MTAELLAYQESRVVQEVRTAAREWQTAVSAGNRKVISMLRHPHFIGIGVDGQRITFTAIPRRDVRQPEVAGDDFRLRIYGEAAVLIHRRTNDSDTARVLSVWVKSHPGWQIVAEQSTRIGGPRRNVPEARTIAPSLSGQEADLQGRDADAVLSAEHELRTAIDLGPLERFTAMLTHDYVGIVRNGTLETHDEVVNRSRQGFEARARLPTPAVPRVQPEHDLRVRVYGDLGVVTGRVFNQGEVIRFIRVFAKRGEEWKLVSSQSTVIAER